MARTLLLLTILLSSIACAGTPEDRRPISELSPEELDAANIIHGEERAVFNAQAAAGKSFILTGTCDVSSKITSITYRGESGVAGSVRLLEDGAVLFPVDPGALVVTGVRLETGESVEVVRGAFRILHGGAVTYIGGLQEFTSQEKAVRFELVPCESLYRRTPKLFPYQIARLPLYIASEIRIPSSQ